jgi:hypothetical protein
MLRTFKSRVVRRTFWLIKVVPTWKKFEKRCPTHLYSFSLRYWHFEMTDIKLPVVLKIQVFRTWSDVEWQLQVFTGVANYHVDFSVGVKQSKKTSIGLIQTTDEHIRVMRTVGNYSQINTTTSTKNWILSEAAFITWNLAQNHYITYFQIQI